MSTGLSRFYLNGSSLCAIDSSVLLWRWVAYAMQAQAPRIVTSDMRSTRVQKSPVRTEGSFPLEPPDVAWPPDRASGSTSPLVTVWATSSRSACSAITLPSCSSVSKATRTWLDCALASKPYSTSTDPEISYGTNGTSALTGPSPALSAQPVSLSMSAPLRTYCSPGTRLA